MRRKLTRAAKYGPFDFIKRSICQQKLREWLICETTTACTLLSGLAERGSGGEVGANVAIVFKMIDLPFSFDVLDRHADVGLEEIHNNQTVGWIYVVGSGSLPALCMWQ